MNFLTLTGTIWAQQFSLRAWGISIPPVIHYEGTIDGIDVEIEFLTDQTDSQDEKVLVVQKGLHAEALRYISILVENTFLLEIDDAEPKQ